MRNFTHDIPDDISSLDGFLSATNSITDGLFGMMLLLMVWFIFFGSFKMKYRSEESFAGASVITMITAVVLFAMGILSETYLTITIVLLVIGVFYLGRK